jgi:hypothetical protein
MMRAVIAEPRRAGAGGPVRALAPPIVHEPLRAPGRPLEATTRRAMERRFGHDFARVRVHVDAGAAHSAHAVGASAYTVGSDVVFGAGRYAPETAAGQHLLAHELSHVVQQSDARDIAAPLPLAGWDGAAEREARQVSDAVGSATSPAEVRSRVQPSVQRAPPRDDDPIHTPVIEDFRRRHGLPPSGLDSSGRTVGPSAAEIKYGDPARAGVVAHELEALIKGATWKEIRKRVYPKESAAGIQRAKERHAGTLPDLTGVGRLSTLDHFAAAVRGIQGRWSTLTPDDRVKALGKAAGDELVAADVPAFLRVDKTPTEFKGFFNPRAWEFEISQELVTSDPLKPEDAAELSNVTLHESRHAEQHFLAARFAAGIGGKDEAAIVAEQRIPAVIAGQAVTKKFTAQTDATTKALGQRMRQSMVTDRAANQAISDDDGLADLLVKRKAAEKTLADLNAVPVEKNISAATTQAQDLRKQIKVVEDKYTLYRNIPYEADAHEVGDAAEQAFRGWP